METRVHLPNHELLLTRRSREDRQNVIYDFTVPIESEASAVPTRTQAIAPSWPPASFNKASSSYFVFEIQFFNSGKS